MRNNQIAHESQIPRLFYLTHNITVHLQQGMNYRFFMLYPHPIHTCIYTNIIYKHIFIERAIYVQDLLVVFLREHAHIAFFQA
jgi:hypothetical protein